MDDSAYGVRNKRGDWKPHDPVKYPKVFVWPWRPVAFLQWLPEYLAPWNLLYAAVAIGLWLYVVPPLDAMKRFEVGWIAYLYACNIGITLAFYGFFHLRLYVQRAQGGRFKYNGKWLDTDNPTFLFRRQIVDNMIWSLGSAVSFLTAYQVITLWMFANHYVPYVDFTEQPTYFVVMMLLIPLVREVHFYAIHRLIHWPPLYRAVHRLHHKNVNPGPWSGLAMHPVEHLLYFSGVLIHWIVPSHPVHALFHLTHAWLGPAPGHSGFDKVEVNGEEAVDTHSYAHYLHHKYFECNYADGAVPLDKWFGTFHDGSDEAHEAMNKRFLRQKQSEGSAAE